MCMQVLEASRRGHQIFWRGCGVYMAWVPFPSSLPLLPSLHRINAHTDMQISKNLKSEPFLVSGISPVGS